MGRTDGAFGLCLLPTMRVISMRFREVVASLSHSCRSPTKYRRNPGSAVAVTAQTRREPHNSYRFPNLPYGGKILAEPTPAASESPNHAPNPPHTPKSNQVRQHPTAYAPVPSNTRAAADSVALNAIRGSHSMLGTRCAATGTEGKPLKEATNGG